MNVLVVEDHADIAANIGDYLEACGHEVDFAADGHFGLNLLRDNRYDVIVLDVMMPRVDGITLCKRLREELLLSIPVLMLTAKDTLDDKVEGFEAGVDDYLVKPFSLKELELRIQALGRRRLDDNSASDSQLRVADLYFDLNTLRVTRAGEVLAINPLQRCLLEVLMKNHHRVVRREELEEALQGLSRGGADTLRVHIHGLRAAVDKPFDSPLIKTVHGVGYRLSDDHS